MRQRPFETRSTDRVAGQAAWSRPIVPAMSPRHARAFPMHPRPSPRSIPRRLRQTDRRNRVSGVAWATSAVHSERDRADVGPHPPGPAMFVAERRRTESDSFTKRANMCADHARTLDACGVATPYRRKRKLAPTAAVLARAQATYRSGFPRRLRPTSFRSHATVSDHPPRSHRRRASTRTTLPTHLRSVQSCAQCFA